MMHPIEINFKNESLAHVSRKMSMTFVLGKMSVTFVFGKMSATLIFGKTSVILVLGKMSMSLVLGKMSLTIENICLRSISEMSGHNVRGEKKDKKSRKNQSHEYGCTPKFSHWTD